MVGYVQMLHFIKCNLLQLNIIGQDDSETMIRMECLHLQTTKGLNLEAMLDENAEAVWKQAFAAEYIDEICWIL